MSQTPFYRAYLPYLLAQAAHRLSLPFHHELKRRDIREMEWRVLSVLAGGAPRPIGDLAQEAIVPQSTLSRRLVKMEAAGLVRRVVDAGDGRVANMSLTPKGARLAAELIACAGKAEARDAAALRATERDTLRLLLARLVD